MTNPNWTNIRRRLGSRTAIVMAGTVGFALGAGGFAAAQHGSTDDPTGPSTTVVGDVVDTTVADTLPATSVDDTTADDTTAPSLDTVDDDATSSTVTDDTTDDTIDDTVDDATSSTVTDDTTDDTIDDDATSSTVTDDTTDDTIDDTVPARPLPAPFTETYTSAGGSISVSWSGTAFSLDAISPAGGFVAEIEDNAWDRIRVDFEGSDDDFRIEVRLNDGSIRVRVD